MGIGDDYLPGGCMKCFWGCLLRCVWPSTKRDLEQMEEIVASSGLDYLLVRPMGVDPAELPRNSYRLLTAPCILRGLVLTFAGFGLRGSGFQD
ncbi:unnamed protein product [Symbiodinium pilosum]|uniref:NAD(P)-binding domain-containing protein n=1 Tax=Symbiodinium pilosum TaxID=2952 RepID=A0A812S6N2_SYMPI|nr:unnamed protein product [Symbiodinium pilosum]